MKKLLLLSFISLFGCVQPIMAKEEGCKKQNIIIQGVDGVWKSTKTSICKSGESLCLMYKDELICM